MTLHKTVLLNEAIEALDLKPGMIVIDATLGGGGHSREILKIIGNKGTLISIDSDSDAIKRFAEFPISPAKSGSRQGGDNFQFPNKSEIINSKIQKIGKIYLVHDNFASLKNILADLKIEKVDAILADLGISSDQLEDENRGISFRRDSLLDMRMDRSQGITAADILNTYDKEKLEKILKEFGNEQYAVSIVRSIIARRKEKLFTCTSELVETIERSVPPAYKHKKIHYATKTFQALRIEVNRELESLGSFLSQAVEVLKSHGRLAIITFHSGEDALVKHTLRKNARGCICPSEFPICQCGKKPIVNLVTRNFLAPSEDEVLENPRSRSAKLRVVEKV